MIAASPTPAAIATGGASGIGRALTDPVLNAEERISILDRDAESLANPEVTLAPLALLGGVIDGGEERP